MHDAMMLQTSSRLLLAATGLCIEFGVQHMKQAVLVKGGLSK
jgi:hypothetical protein